MFGYKYVLIAVPLYKMLDNQQPEVSSLDESIHILNVIDEKFNDYFEALTMLAQFSVPVEVVAHLHQLTYEHGVILINSYLDELHKHFRPSLTNEENAAFSQYYNLIKKEINRFPDIKRYRNNVCAHNLRHDDRSIYLYGHLRKYKVPQNIAEFKFVKDCINLMTQVVNISFPMSCNNVRAIVDTRFANDTTPHISSLPKDKLETMASDLVNKLRILQKK
ncbi:hypothetical protein [Pedobacter borealis]|uniref:hypothetical protein n=1 Tax=Pedobacter borealis TaxID=475254 RepID=UPI000492F29E|nr:hypothetical protein [Pedobacter borealis]